ncbi:hypothetical protein HAX54_030843 [Datura stramonium]|uniref:Cyclin-D1-binding protein 1-like N-terminal domain-containing protein n=1 Tax=Datura stramonium TaxID=4076 RepID=A0ABS8V977_DATST|nr:hypothetical protein [Datura stramonium]
MENTEEGLLLKERESVELRWGVIWEEVKEVGYLAGPMMAVTLSQYLFANNIVMMVGHLGELSLSSTSIAVSIAGVTGFSILVILGAAVAIGISMWLNVIILALYMRLSPACAKTHAPMSWEIVKGVREFFQFAIPSAIMICLEWWSYELMILLSGLCRIPNLKLQFYLYATETIMVAQLYLLLETYLAVFSSEKEPPFLQRDSIAGSLAFWLHLRGKGLWIGIVSGAALQTILLAVITCCTNWKKQAAMARERLHAYSEKSSMEGFRGETEKNGKAAKEQLNRALNEHLNTIHETLQALNQTTSSSLEKVSWKEVIQMGEQLYKQATMVECFGLEKLQRLKTSLEENMASYFSMLQGALLLPLNTDGEVRMLRGNSSNEGVARRSLQKTPATNITAIGRAMTQVAVSMKDVLREMNELKPASSDVGDESSVQDSAEGESKSQDSDDSFAGDLGVIFLRRR